MKILVTGATGTIGKCLMKELSKKHEVSAFEKDIRNCNDVEEAVKGKQYVIHLAAVLDEHEKDLFEVNVNGTKNICESCAKNKANLIFLSSTGVMGDFEGTANENTPLNPKTKYEKSKAEAEKLVLGYQETIFVAVIRSALVLAPNNAWKQIMHYIEKDIPLIGNGAQPFQIIYVQDVVSAIMLILEKNKESGEIFIVAEEKPFTLREFVKIVREELGMKTELKTIPVWLGYLIAIFYEIKNIFARKKSMIGIPYVKRLLRQRKYSTKKIQSLGWHQRITTKKAIELTIKEIKKK
jgi:nucleoside-diphosphate-sugar epimerase